MNARLRNYVILIVGIVCLSSPVAAQWTDGQNAAYVVGQADFTSGSSDTTQSRLYSPRAMALDLVNGKLYVADADNHRVLRFAYPITGNQPNAEAVLGQANFTTRIFQTSQSGMEEPTGLAVDATGRLWVADHNSNRVLRFDAAHAKANGANADGVLGQANFTSGSPATSQSGLNLPSSVALDATGRLWVADSDNNRILRFDDAANKPNGANADGVLGQTDFTSNLAAAAPDFMHVPTGVVVDTAGRLWITDSGNYRVLRFDAAHTKANGANADGVLGQADFVSISFTTARNTMNSPHGAAALDLTGRLYVADTQNHRVLLFNDAAGKANGANADNVLGQTNFTSNTSATTQSGMNKPWGVCIDSANNCLLTGSELNDRVLQFNASDTLPVELTAFQVE